MQGWVTALSLAVLSCGPGDADPDDLPELATCPIDDSPTFELGAGERVYVPLRDGDQLEMTQGPQGGCHFWVSVRTKGFAERRFEIAHRVLEYPSLVETPSRSRQRVRLSLVPGTLECEYTGYVAYLIEPWTLDGRELVLEVTVMDDLGRTSTASRRIRAVGVDGTVCHAAS
ncbi:MAG: hypothetical protein HYV07_08275 [Deltaproteobacteria bacterium]|nr:hypothetical protein [Deltaproteobacteria bacterium]